MSEPLIGDANHTTVGMVLRIGADAPVFASPDLERITVNFDLNTGTVTLGPLVENFGAPPDRWLNEDPINDFTLTSFGGGAYRIEGSVPHGTEPFVAGDFINQVLQREVNSHLNPSQVDFVLSGVPIDACDNQIGENVSIGFGVTLGSGLIIENGASIGDFSVIGDQVFIGLDAVIGNNTELGDGAQIARDVVIGDRVQGLTAINTVFHPVVIDKGATVGDDTLLEATEIGAGAMVGSGVIARSFVDPVTHDISVVTIERKATVGDGADLDFGTFVGRGVILGDGVSTTTVINHVFHPVTFDKGATVGANSSFGGNTVVEMKASIGTGAIVGEDVVIEKHAIVGNDVTLLDGAIVPKGAVVLSGTTFP